MDIELGRVERVLLVDGWHSVLEWSFTVDRSRWISAIHGVEGGFVFKSAEGIVTGPLSSVLAVLVSPE